MWREILISSFSWSNVSRAVHSYSWDVNFYLFSSTADPILTEASIPTTHGSSHGLVPQVQYSEHFSSPDIHTHHHSAPSTIFTPGESLSTDPYLISGPGPSTVTEDEPIDEVMMPDESDGPNSYCCSWVWNSVKDYWERLYGSVVYSMTKLLIGRECYWALLALRVSELKVVPFLWWSEGFEDFVQCLFSSWTKVFDRLKFLTRHFVHREPLNTVKFRKYAPPNISPPIQ